MGWVGWRVGVHGKAFNEENVMAKASRAGTRVNGALARN